MALKPSSDLEKESEGRKFSAVEEALAAISLAECAGDSNRKGGGNTIPDPADHYKDSKTDEVDMDVNEVVAHKRPGSIAIGVTPSDPSAIVDLFQEVESIGSVRLPDESETGSTTGEGDESGEHAPPASAFVPRNGVPLQTVSASNTDARPAPCVGTSGSSERYHTHYNPAVKLWSQNKGSSASGSATAIGTEEGASFSQQPPSAPRNGSTVGGDVWARDETIPDPAGRGDGNCPLTGAWGGGVPPEGNEKKQETRKAPMCERLNATFGGPVQRTGGTWKLLTSTASEEAEAQRQVEDQTASSVVEPAAASQNTFVASRQGSGPVIPLQRLNSVSASGGEASLSDVPFRRKTSMGSFQKGMGESLTGRLRKQLDIPREPKSEVNLNIPIDEIRELKYLAQGAMCVAYTAVLNGKTVVLKTPLPNTNHAAVAANDLEVEMLLLRELHHENIVSLHGAGYLPDGRRFVALEYLSGGTLSSVLRNREAKPLSMSKVLDLSLALCNALEYLHDVAVPGRIVCHRDLKPDNIGFAEDGTLKLIDFGLGKIIKRRFRVRADKYNMTGGTGSLRYMAPEIADHQEYNEKGDVYSFSLIMWEMLAGQKPFLGLKRPDFYSRVVDKGERPHLNPEWPEQVRHLLESCWRTNLDERLSFREVGGILKVCAEEENQRCFKEEKRRIVRTTTRRTRLWSGGTPNLGEISSDPQYKPKFKISSFFAPKNSSINSVVERTTRRLRSRKSDVRRNSNDT